MRRALIRVDAGLALGAGHLVRCLALGQGLEGEGWRVTLAGAAAGFTLLPLPAWPRIDLTGIAAADEPDCLREALGGPADLLVVDHYRRDAAFERACRSWATRILAIDDLADRPHDCDWLLDSTPQREAAAYASLLPPRSDCLVGSAYALLRPGFARRRWRLAPRRADVEHVLLSLGATDPDRVILAALDALESCGFKGKVTAMLAPAAAHHAVLAARLAAIGGTLLAPDADVAAAFAECDLAIGAGGVGLLERASLGLPTLLVEVAANQRANLAAMTSIGAAVMAERPDTVGIASSLRPLLADAGLRAGVAQRSAALCDGLGVGRTLLALDGGPRRLRPASAADSEQLLAWQRHPITRRYARDPEPPSPARHEAWLAAKLSDPRCAFHILTEHGRPVGYLRLDWLADREGFEVSVAVDPDRHGAGLGAAALAYGRRLVPDEDLWAYIVPQNQASLGLFRKAGYRPSEIDGWYIHPGRVST